MQRAPPLPLHDVALSPPQDHRNRHHEVGANAFAWEDLQGLICSDLPGRFSIISHRNMSYIFLLYDYDSNAILAEPIRSHHAHHLVEGYDKCYKCLHAAGITPVLQRLDNEVSDLLCRSITEKYIQYQLCNAYNHRHNLAERAIQTFKTHFISIINGCDD